MTFGWATASSPAVAIPRSECTSDTGCGTIARSELTLEPAAVSAYTQNIILREGYSRQAELVPDDTVPAVTSMAERSDPASRPRCP